MGFSRSSPSRNISRRIVETLEDFLSDDMPCTRYGRHRRRDRQSLWFNESDKLLDLPRGVE